MQEKIWSGFSKKEITKAQYLAEQVLIRQAKKEGKSINGNLWHNEQWKRRFILQIKFANELLKLYPFKAIITAFNKLSWVTTLGAKKVLDPLIQEEVLSLKIQAENQELLKEESPKLNAPSEKPTEDRKVFSKKPSLKNRLD